jgi:dCTP diphosphatase
MTSSSEGKDEQTLAALMRAVQDFADARDWSQFHDPKNLAMSLASEVGELAAVLRWVRGEDADAFVASGPHRDALEAEIGDVGICLLLLCARVHVGLDSAIRAKLTANAVKYPVEGSRGRADRPPGPPSG